MALHVKRRFAILVQNFAHFFPKLGAWPILQKSGVIKQGNHQHKVVSILIFHTMTIYNMLVKQTREKIKSNLLLYSLHYAKACNELARPISASLRPRNTAPFEEMLQRWRSVGNTVSDLTGPRFEPLISSSRDERITARPMQRS